jgi:hypothetical protein
VFCYRLRLTVQEMNYASRRLFELQTGCRAGAQTRTQGMSVFSSIQ